MKRYSYLDVFKLVFLIDKVCDLFRITEYKFEGIIVGSSSQSHVQTTTNFGADQFKLGLIEQFFLAENRLPVRSTYIKFYPLNCLTRS